MSTAALFLDNVDRLHFSTGRCWQAAFFTGQCRTRKVQLSTLMALWITISKPGTFDTCAYWQYILFLLWLQSVIMSFLKWCQCTMYNKRLPNQSKHKYVSAIYKLTKYLQKKLWDDMIPWRLNYYVLILFVWLVTLGRDEKGCKMHVDGCRPSTS